MIRGRQISANAACSPVGGRNLGRSQWLIMGLVAACLFGQARDARCQPAPPIGVLSGVVTSAKTKEPLVGAVLLICRTATTGEADVWQWLVNTDEAGRYEFPTLPVGSYQLGLIQQGYVPQSDSVEITGAAPVTRSFELAPLREVIGRVARYDGKPLTAQQIHYDSAKPKSLRSTVVGALRGTWSVFLDPMTGSVSLEKDGSFRLPGMVPEQFMLIIEAEGEGGALVDVAFPEQGNADLGVVQLKPWVSMNGTVVNAETKAPVPSAYVYLRPKSEQSTVWEGRYYFNYTTTDANGQFSFRKVVPFGSYTLYSYARGSGASLQGNAPQTDFSTPGQSYSVTIELSGPKRR